MRTSEYVSLGHPDKVADYISEYLLDRYLEQDPDTRYAVEVQIKDTRVCLGGEVTSKASFGPEQIEKYVQEAVREIGYTKEYADKWGRENTISADDIECHCFISQQSPDIAQGVDRDGWGDQGIFFGYAEPLDWGHNGLRADRYCAENRLRYLGDDLCCCGIDGMGWRDNKANLNSFLYDKKNFVSSPAQCVPGTARPFNAIHQNSVYQRWAKTGSYKDAMLLETESNSLVKNDNTIHRTYPAGETLREPLCEA